jgi:aryl-alcohol dehydrogenase-like predicted oxidoreductase
MPTLWQKLQSMRSLTLPDGTRCSALGFGCGAVMGRVGRGASLRAMSAALDAGVTLFDTARSYGYGESEAVLGEFLAGRREQVLVSTKFGTQPGQRQRWKTVLRPLAGAILRSFPGARQAARRSVAGAGAGVQITALPISPESLALSLEQSLSRLRTDYVDFLFLHDVPPSAVERDDIFASLLNLQQEGKVRRFGVSSSLETAEAANRLRPEASAVQLPVNLSNLCRAEAVLEHALEGNARVVLANNIFGGFDGAAGSQRKIQGLLVDQTLPTELRSKLAEMGPRAMSGVLLPLVLRAVGAQVAIVSMMSTRNVAANLRAVDDDPWSDEELKRLLAKLAVS